MFYPMLMISVMTKMASGFVVLVSQNLDTSKFQNATAFRLNQLAITGRLLSQALTTGSSNLLHSINGVYEVL